MAKIKITDRVVDDIAQKIVTWFGQIGDNYELGFRDIYEILARAGELIQKAEGKRE